MSTGMVRVSAHVPRGQVDSLISQLVRHYEQYGTGASCIELPRNLRRELDDTDYELLQEKTYQQLSRWCHTNRWSRREKFVQPIARRVSKLLFGHVIDRVN